MEAILVTALQQAGVPVTMAVILGAVIARVYMQFCKQLTKQADLLAAMEAKLKTNIDTTHTDNIQQAAMNTVRLDTKLSDVQTALSTLNQNFITHLDKHP